MAENLPVKDGTQVIDAEGAYVTPGGIDSHVHLNQLYNAATDGLMVTQINNGVIPDRENYPHDTYDMGTRSAVAGGTTTVISFANQLRDDHSLAPVIGEYHKMAAGKSYCDYAFHCILSNPTKKVLEEDLPWIVQEHGITSIKIYMTYQALMLRDYQILDVLHAARKLGITTMVHAENADVIDWMTEHLEEQGMTAPYYHGTSRPTIAEAEAAVSIPLPSPFLILLTISAESRYIFIRIDGHAYPFSTHLRSQDNKGRSRGSDATPPRLRRDLSSILVPTS